MGTRYKYVWIDKGPYEPYSAFVNRINAHGQQGFKVVDGSFRSSQGYAGVMMEKAERD